MSEEAKAINTAEVPEKMEEMHHPHQAWLEDTRKPGPKLDWLVIDRTLRPEGVHFEKESGKGNLEAK